MTTQTSDGGDSGELSPAIYAPVNGAPLAPFATQIQQSLITAIRELRNGVASLFVQANNRDTVSEIGLAETTLATSWLSGRMPADKTPALMPIVDHRHVDGLPTDAALPDAQFNGPFSAVEMEIIFDPFCVSNGHLSNLPDWPVR